MVIGDQLASDITLPMVEKLIHGDALLQPSPQPLVPHTPPNPPTSFISWYGLEICFALVSVNLLWNLMLCCRIQYSPNTQVTKLTFLPYLFSFVFLLIQFIESISLLIVNMEEQDRADKDDKNWRIDKILE